MSRHQAFRSGAVAAAVLAAGGVTRPAAAAPPPARVSVLTMGPGEHPFTRFGHNAILLEWEGPEGKRDAVYNYGTFEFDGLKGVRDFMAGRFRYWVSRSTLPRTLRAYAADQRSLVAQELALTADERGRLAATLERNALPEHRYYDYDYYADNCSTRVRDVLDQLLEGRLQQSTRGPGRLTFRQHTLRLVGQSTYLYAGLNLALGAPTDSPITRWQELFLPQELHDALATTQRQLDGRTVPLVQSERRLLTSSRPLPPTQPPERRPGFALAGVTLGASLFGLGQAASTRRRLRAVFGSAAALLGLLAGSLGLVFTGFWLFSKHWAAYRNFSLLLCPPWALALVALGTLVALGRARWVGPLHRWLALVVAPAAVALGLALLGGRDEAQPLALLILPIWLGLLLGLRGWARGASTNPS
jgi:hypothetical protein